MPDQSAETAHVKNLHPDAHTSDKAEPTYEIQAHILMDLGILAAKAAFRGAVQDRYNDLSEVTGYRLGKMTLIGELPGDKELKTKLDRF